MCFEIVCHARAILENFNCLLESCSRDLDNETLRQKLMQAEEHGVVRKKSISQSDEQAQT
jgi:DNA-binding HxlR family transcriptional regulator